MKAISVSIAPSSPAGEGRDSTLGHEDVEHVTPKTSSSVAFYCPGRKALRHQSGQSCAWEHSEPAGAG